MRITLTSDPGRFKDTRVAQLQLHLVVVEESGTILRVRSNAPRRVQTTQLDDQLGRNHQIREYISLTIGIIAIETGL